ncbi:MAG: Crp/Fnr family transcriptional regulator [Rhodospirillales bacterium]|nr:Crp/Fnr family transcriptional regulator [Rhodospirillales bacterium]
MTAHWIDRFPALQFLEAPALALLQESARLDRLAPDHVLYRRGDRCNRSILVVEGTLRVRLIAEGGGEIVLHRVERGEPCILTVCSIMARENYLAEGVAEGPLLAATLPAVRFRELLGLSAMFRDFIFFGFGARIAQMLSLVETVTFEPIDKRLASALLALAGPARRVEASHEELAVELGTAREVVSRALKRFERRGWVRLARRRIDLMDPEALRALQKG